MDHADSGSPEQKFHRRGSDSKPKGADAYSPDSAAAAGGVGGGAHVMANKDRDVTLDGITAKFFCYKREFKPKKQGPHVN